MKIKPPRRERPPVTIPAILQIVIECKTEEQQHMLYDRLKEEGYTCRVLTL
jgi:hypothetical protein